MVKEVQEKQAKVMEEAKKDHGKGMTKEEFMKKAAEESGKAAVGADDGGQTAAGDSKQTEKQEQKKEKKQNKKEKQTKQKKKEEQPKKNKSSKARIVGVKDLEKEFGVPGKTIRRYLRRMEENTKPRGPEPYQWYENSKEFKAIKEKLAEVVKRKPGIVR